MSGEEETRRVTVPVVWALWESVTVNWKESAVPFVVVLPTLDKESRLLVDWLRFRSDEAVDEAVE